MSKLAMNMPKREVYDETEDKKYVTIEDCMIERDNGTFEMAGWLKEIMEGHLAATRRGEFSSRSFWQIVEEAWLRNRNV